MRLFSGWDTREEAIHHRYLRNKSFNYLLARARAECNIAGPWYLHTALSFMYLPLAFKRWESRELYQNEKNTLFHLRVVRIATDLEINILLFCDIGHSLR